jgi:hypothetical protein
MNCQSPTTASQNLPFLGNKTTDWELWISIFQPIDESICMSSIMDRLVIPDYVIPKIQTCSSTSKF